MCHQDILGFKSCGHSATTLIICERNGETSFQECPRGWSGELNLEDGLCLGCQSTFSLPGLSHDQVLSSIKTRPRKMPFSYVAYGLIPRSAAHCAELTDQEPFIIISPCNDPGPSREWLSLPPPPPWEREQATWDQTKRPTQANKEPVRNAISPPYSDKEAQTMSIQSENKSSSPSVITPTSFEDQHIPHSTAHKTPSALKNKSGSALDRYSNRTQTKKSVTFFQQSHVQYFFQDVRTISVSSHSTGMHKYCAEEQVVWGPKPHPHWRGPAKEGSNENTAGATMARVEERGMALGERELL